MFSRLPFGQFPAAMKAVANALRARVARRLDGHVIFDSQPVSDTDFGSPLQPPQPPRDVPWDAGLDFSRPPSMPSPDLPRFLAANAPSPCAPALRSASHPLSAIVVRRVRLAVMRTMHVLRSRAPAFLIALLLVLCWRSAGQSGPLPQARNSAADAVAERFAVPDVNSTDAEETLSSTHRIDFAPRFAGLYGGRLNAGRPPAQLPGSLAVSEAQPEAAIADPAGPPLADDVGVVIVHAPARTQSVGTRTHTRGALRKQTHVTHAPAHPQSRYREFLDAPGRHRALCRLKSEIACGCRQLSGGAPKSCGRIASARH